MSNVPWHLKSKREQLKEAIECRKRRIEQLEKSSWFGDPPWLKDELIMSALEAELRREEEKERK